MHGRVHVEELGEDEGRKRDGDDVRERLMEEHDRSQHNYTALVAKNKTIN